MKKRTGFIIAMWLPFAVVTADDVKPVAPAHSSNGPVVQKVGDDNAIKRLFDEMWAKLRSYGPKLNTSAVHDNATVVAGIRGAESTSSQLKPYWKGDRTGDPAYAQEVTAYNIAQSLAESGEVVKAAAAFEEFLKNHPKSVFTPNARFGLGLAYSAADQKEKGVSAFEGLIRDFPTHPLSMDAKRVNEALQKPQ